MKSPALTSLLRIASAILIFGFLVSAAWSGQSGTGTIRGQVTDPSGAAVPDAIVQVSGANGKPSTVKSGRDGTYEVKGLPAGTYAVKADAKGFQEYQSAQIQLAAGSKVFVRGPELCFALLDSKTAHLDGDLWYESEALWSV